MKINLLEVNISGFQNISENQSISFDTCGIYSIIGKNLDEGGSNASGKSSFVRAITSGILGTGFVSVNNKEIKNRILNIQPKIYVKLSINDKILEITRIIGGKLTALIDGVEIIGKIDEIQQKIINFLNIRPEHFLHLTHKMQESFGGFLLMKDSEKKEFLGSFFDIEKLDKIAEENDAELKNINAQIIQNTERLNLLTTEVNILKSELDTLQQKVLECTSTEYLSNLANKKIEMLNKENELQALKKITYIDELLNENEKELYKNLVIKKETLIEQLNSLTNSNNITNKEIIDQINKIKKELSEPIIIPLELTEALNDIDLKIKKHKETVNTILLYKTNKNNIEAQSNQIKDKNKKLQANICITCGQQVDSATYNKIKEQLQKEAAALEQKINEIDTQIKDLEKTITSSEEELTQTKQTILLQIAEFKASKNKTPLKQTLSSLEEQLLLNNKKIEEIKNNIKEIDFLLNKTEQTIKETHKAKISKIEAEIASIQKDIAISEKQSKDIKNLFNTVNEKYLKQTQKIKEIEEALKQSSRLLKIRSKITEVLSKNGFIGYIFDNILEEINREVNENIKMIPIISRLSMYFSPDKTVKSTKNINKAIVYKLFDNNEEISFESLSGSEKESLLLAVDVAVDTVLCTRLGVDINYKIFDEQFGWVDGSNKEFLLDFIKQKYYNKIIMIIDHGSELNASIDKKIIITKHNGIATVCQTS